MLDEQTRAERYLHTGALDLRWSGYSVSVEERRGKNGKQVQRGKQNVQSLSVLFSSLIKLSSAILFELQIS